jgi:hypothetical protein
MSEYRSYLEKTVRVKYEMKSLLAVERYQSDQMIERNRPIFGNVAKNIKTQIEGPK